MFDSRSRRSQTDFHCVTCGHSEHADLNAEWNKLAFGTGASARREAIVPATPMNLENTTRVA